MALGFHKSLFGYNCDEVSEYVRKTLASNQEIQNSLNEKIKNFEAQVGGLSSTIKDLEAQKAESEQQLEFYKEKYDEVKTLSENIGKLYLVAQTNANAIMNAAEDAKASAKAEIDNNISVIDATNESLNKMKVYVAEITAEFAARVDELNNSLEKTKFIIKRSTEISDETKAEFETIFNSLTK